LTASPPGEALLEPTLRRSLLLHNDERELRRMSRWFRQLAGEIGLDAAKTDDLELCLNELLVNVLNYAYAADDHSDDADSDDRAREIRVVAEGDARDLRVSVEDDGTPFDPRTRPSPARPDSLEHAGIGGWGLPIVRAFAQDLTYERCEGWNRVTISSAGPSTAPSGVASVPRSEPTI
jgi:anti-sigma regulatory factor (Ser/Thr protein kinase)